jgi:hypothetical protein
VGSRVRLSRIEYYLLDNLHVFMLSALKYEVKRKAAAIK